MRITRIDDGVRVRLNIAESHVLEQLFTELQADLDPDALDRADPVRVRLYPAGYDDAEAAQAFRDMTETTLRQERTGRVDECLAEVLAGRSLRRTEVRLDAAGTERWLQVINDLRLTVGTRLAITEDDDYLLDEQDPDVALRARYLWLTAFQDALVTTVTG